MMQDVIDVLYIAEKPSLAVAISDVLPGSAIKMRTHITIGTTVLTWCFGHMLEQLMPEEYDTRYKTWNFDDLPFVPREWKKKPRKDAAAQVAAIKSLHARAKRIVHAGDPDQEGQLIVDELLAHFGNTKPVSRILVNDYNVEKVRESIAAIQPNTNARFTGWSAWAECRSRLDFMFGINLTRAFTLRAKSGGYDGVTSVGRVQTPTLAMVVTRDELIENFKPIPFYSLTSTAIAGEARFDAKWKPRETQEGLDDERRLVDGALATTLASRLSRAPVKVTEFVESTKTQSAPLPFSLKTLQMAANDHFGYTGTQTLDAAQALYETHKLTTYPRGDSQHLSLAQHAESAARLAAVAANFPALLGAVATANPQRRSDAFNDSKVTAHHAIVPTATRSRTDNLSETERNIYELISRVFVAQFHPPHLYQQSNGTLDVGGETFVASGRRTTDPGWKAIFTAIDDEADTEQGTSPQSLPPLSVGAPLTNGGVRALSKHTTAPARFTHKTLLGAMGNAHKYVTNPAAKARLKEGQGIGTPATSAGIIDELVKRGYIDSKKGSKHLISSSIARTVIHALPPIATDAGFTGLTEQTLDQVAAGAIEPHIFLQKSAELVANLVRQAARTEMKFPVHSCPLCKEGILRRRKGTKGHFWGCSRYDAGCKAAYDDNKGKPQFAPRAKKAAGKKPAGKKAGGGGGAASKPAARGKSARTVARRGADRSGGAER